MSKAFESIKEGLLEAIEFVDGQETGARAHKIKVIDVKRLRTQIGMNCSEFTSLFGISPATVRHWENGD